MKLSSHPISPGLPAETTTHGVSKWGWFVYQNIYLLEMDWRALTHVQPLNNDDFS